MRDILFRAKRKDDGKWAYGSLIKVSFHNQKNVVCIVGNDLNKPIPVDPETVGQYTGICDANKKKIYEGDIIHLQRKDKRGRVFWYNNDASLSMKIGNGYVLGLSAEETEDYKVIGNVYDGEKDK